MTEVLRDFADDATEVVDVVDPVVPDVTAIIGITSDIISLDADIVAAIDRSEDVTVETAVLFGATSDVTVESTVIDETVVDMTELTAVSSEVVGVVLVEVNIKHTISQGMVGTTAYRSSEDFDNLIALYVSAIS